MKRLTVTIGLFVILGVLTPLVGGAQERVEAFDRLTGLVRESHCPTIPKERVR